VVADLGPEERSAEKERWNGNPHQYQINVTSSAMILGQAEVLPRSGGDSFTTSTSASSGSSTPFVKERSPIGRNELMMRSSWKKPKEWSALMHCVINEAQKHLLMFSDRNHPGTVSNEVRVSGRNNDSVEFSSNVQAALYAMPVRQAPE
jgi:hypothetical protein